MKKQHLKALLECALESLEVIGTEPVDLKDGYDHGKAQRAHARYVSKFIRERLKNHHDSGLAKQKQEEKLLYMDGPESIVEAQLTK